MNWIRLEVRKITTMVASTVRNIIATAVAAMKSNQLKVNNLKILQMT
jgi:hypothetical protein